MTSLPPLVVSLGDPCGIGPEIVAAAWQAVRGDPDLAFCVIGDTGVLEAQGVPVAAVGHPSEAAGVFADALPVIDQSLSTRPVAGQPDSVHAPSIIGWIKAGVDLCLAGAAGGGGSPPHAH